MLERFIQLISQAMLGLLPLAAVAQTSELPMTCPGCNLQGIDFNSVSMGDKRFIDSNFSRADLRRANLSNMYMLTTNLQGADLRGADLSHTFLLHRQVFEMLTFVARIWMMCGSPMQISAELIFAAPTWS